jgi:hypothetical protein
MSTKETGVNAAVVAVAGWLIPGSGYLLIGQRSRGLTVGITILILFVLGLLIGGIRVVDPPDTNPLGNPMGAVMQRPWFVGQVLIGPVGIITGLAGKSWKFPMAHSHMYELGTLYTAIAGMLNLLALIDSAHRAGHPQVSK